MAETFSDRGDEPTIISGFARETPASGGYIAAPASVRAAGKNLIQNLLPGDWRLVMHVSAQLDQDSGIVSLDTTDSIPGKPTQLSELETRVGVMRILRGMGDKALDGWVLDYRYVKKPKTDDRELSEGVGSIKFMEAQSKFGAVLPLGAVFNDDGEPHYIGKPEAKAETLWLAQQVDELVHELRRAEAAEKTNQSADSQQIHSDLP